MIIVVIGVCTVVLALCLWGFCSALDALAKPFLWWIPDTKKIKK